MVNVLETLYVLTAISFVMAIVSLARRRRPGARWFGILTASGVLVCAGMSWYLG
jgi:hypothetical protein